MTLAALNPRRTRHYLIFRCPCGSGHKQRVPIRQAWKGQFIWGIKGRMPRVTLMPSVRSDCAHFSVIDGQVVMAG